MVFCNLIGSVVLHGTIVCQPLLAESQIDELWYSEKIHAVVE